jgi:hypothetical protein
MPASGDRPLNHILSHLCANVLDRRKHRTTGAQKKPRFGGALELPAAGAGAFLCQRSPNELILSLAFRAIAA